MGGGRGPRRSTRNRRRSASGWKCGAALAGLAIVTLARSAQAQIPYAVFDAATQVRSLHFEFPSGRSFPVSELKLEMALSAPGALYSIRRLLAILPLVPDPPPHPFTPLELQRDVARLRRFYADAGFLGTGVHYDVAFDRSHNAVRIRMIVDEGRPVIVRSIAVQTSAGGDPGTQLPEAMQAAWRNFVQGRQDLIGARLTDTAQTRLVGRVLDWWMARGWAFAQAASEVRVDSASASSDVRVTLDPGPRARVDSIQIEGNHSVSDALVRRTVPLAPGDWFSSAKLAAGQRRLFALNLFRLALTDVPAQPADSTVTIRARVEESAPRLLTGELGYVTAGGLTTRGQFLHRNFTGGARTLDVSGVAQTGVLAGGELPERDFRLSVSYRTPQLFHDPRLSLTLAPFGEYRDNQVDRSWQYGVETTVIYELGPYRFVTFQHRLSSRRVLDYRIGSGSSIDLVTLLQLLAEGALDSVGTRIDRSTFSLSGTIGRFDPGTTTRALQFRPSAEITAPPSTNTIEFWHAELPLVGFLPLRRRVSLAAQVSVGRVFPFGKTVTGDSISGGLQVLQLRDVLLTAGGTGSIRGWGTGLLGPKFVNIEFPGLPVTDSSQLVANGYAPSGGLARATASLELRLPFPGLSERWATHFFTDAARVWNPDSRYHVDDPYGQQRWFFGAGGGIDVRTLIGPIRVSLGYKLNPSPLDLRDADRVLRALQQDLPLSTVPTDWKHRLHIHVSLGQSF